MKDLKYDIRLNGLRCELVKRSNGEVVPLDEPVFVMRARDNLAIPTLQAYLRYAYQEGCTDYHIQGCKRVLRAFKYFAKKHPERMKQPGITRGK